MSYEVILLGRKMKNEWNPMEKSLYDHIKDDLLIKREYDECKQKLLNYEKEETL